MDESALNFMWRLQKIGGRGGGRRFQTMKVCRNNLDSKPKGGCFGRLYPSVRSSSPALKRDLVDVLHVLLKFDKIIHVCSYMRFMNFSDGLLLHMDVRK